MALPYKPPRWDPVTGTWVEDGQPYDTGSGLPTTMPGENTQTGAGNGSIGTDAVPTTQPYVPPVPQPVSPPQAATPQPTTPQAPAGYKPTTPGWTYQGAGYQPVAVTPSSPFQPGVINVPPPPKPPPPPPPAPDFMSVIARLGAPKAGPRYATPEGGLSTGILPELEQYALDYLANPNRYTSEFVSSSRALMDADARAARETGTAATSEWAAKRGLIGSSYEGEQRLALEDQIERNRLAQQTELLELMALAEAQDRMAAGNFGLGVGELGRGYASDLRDEAHFTHDAERLRQRDLEEDTLARGELELEAIIAGDDSALARYEQEMEALRLMEESTMSREELARMDEDRRLRAWEIQEDFNLRGQQISSDQAIAMADMEIRRNKLDQDWANAERDRELQKYISENADLLRAMGLL